MRRETLAIPPGYRGDHARRLTDVASVGARKEQTKVPALAELIELHEPRAQFGSLCLFLFLEFCKFLAESADIGDDAFLVGLRLPELLVFDLPIELETAQIAEQRPCFEGEAVGFLGERPEAFVGLPGERFGARAVVLLGGDGSRNRQKDKEKQAFHKMGEAEKLYHLRVRILGVDVGRRRIGLAISDPSGTLARPLTTLSIDGDAAVERVVQEIERLKADADGLDAVVVGRPARLDGSATEQTAEVARFVSRLRERTTVPVHEEDERLSSREAESRLALRERDWRKRKERLDAAAAAVILQDYLDRRTL